MITWKDCLDHPYRRAGRFWTFVLDRFGFVAIALPWSIYCKESHIADPRIARHEYQHIAQMRRDGMLVWWVTAGYYLLRFGYWDSPYEIEARAVQNAD